MARPVALTLRLLDWAETTTVAGLYRETFTRGAFTANLLTRDIPLLYGHDPRLIVGVMEPGGWSDEPSGQYGLALLDVDDTLAAELARKVAAGFITGVSVGYNAVRTRWEHPTVWDPAESEALDTAHREQVDLMEVSLTPVPQYRTGAITAVHYPATAKAAA